jgi:hypothetical protein
LQLIGWQVITTKTASYQEQYEIRQLIDGDVTRLYVHYNQNGCVTGMRVQDPRKETSVLIPLSEAAALTSISDDDGRRIMQYVRERLAEASLRVVGACRDGEYQLTALVVSSASERAQIHISHKKDGMVGSLRLVKVTGEQVGKDIRSALFPSNRGE